MGKRRYKPRPYKTGATRGASVLSPQEYKRDALVQVWMDSRYLATLAEWLERNGYRLKFMSDVVNESLVMLVDKLTSQQMARMVEGAGEARGILDERFGVDLNPNHRGEKNLQNNLMMDSVRGVAREKQGLDDLEIAEAKEAARKWEIERFGEVRSDSLRGEGVETMPAKTRNVNEDVDEVTRKFREKEKKEKEKLEGLGRPE